MQCCLLDKVYLNVLSICNNLNSSSVKFDYKQGNLVEIPRWKAVILNPISHPKPKEVAFAWLELQLTELRRIRGELKEDNGQFFFIHNQKRVNILKEKSQEILQEVDPVLVELKSSLEELPPKNARKLYRLLSSSKILDQLRVELNNWNEKLANIELN